MSESTERTSQEPSEDPQQIIQGILERQAQAREAAHRRRIQDKPDAGHVPQQASER